MFVKIWEIGKYLRSKAWEYMRNLMGKLFTSNLGKYILLPLFVVFISGVFVNIFGWLQGPTEYRIYIVGSFEELGWSEIYDGFRERWNQKPISVNDVPIRADFLDWKDLPKAEEIANEIALRTDVLAVVGHGNSSASRIALPVYMAQDPKIPVILVTETNPDLLPRRCDPPEMPCPVLRLSPTDDDQAETAVEFGIYSGCRDVGVVRDSSNPVYGNYLADKIVNSLHEWGASVMISTEASNVLLANPAVSRGIDCFFFIGRYYNALTLMRQTQADNSNPKRKYILTDSSAVPELVEFGLDMRKVYLTHPRSADEIGRKEVGYTRYGLDAAWIMERLIVRANEILTMDTSIPSGVRKWLGIRRVIDAREALGTAMLQLRRMKGAPSKRDYSFDRRGHLLGERFHVWEIEDQMFKEKEYKRMEYIRTNLQHQVHELHQ